MTTEVALRKFKVDDYYRMLAAGILSEDDRVELIEGKVVEMPPIGSHHADVVDTLHELLSSALGDLGRVRVQNPLRLTDESEPVPDIAIVKRRRYGAGHPEPADVSLVIEVSDTTLRFDLATKVPIYALSGIPEVWVMDIAGSQVHVFRSPSGANYRDMHIARLGEDVSPLKFPGVRMSLAAIFNEH